MEILTVRQIAERLQVSVGSVYTLINSGRLKASRIGRNSGSLRILDSDLAAYLDSCTVPNPVKTLPKPFFEKTLRKAVMLPGDIDYSA